MPADNTLPDLSAGHNDGANPYPCHTQPVPPGPRNAQWAINYGYCRTSLDYQPPHYKQGSSDPRCPRDCPHKAPPQVARSFGVIFAMSGAKRAAEYSTKHHNKHAKKV